MNDLKLILMFFFISLIAFSRFVNGSFCCIRRTDTKSSVLILCYSNLVLRFDVSLLKNVLILQK